MESKGWSPTSAGAEVGGSVDQGVSRRTAGMITESRGPLRRIAVLHLHRFGPTRAGMLEHVGAPSAACTSRPMTMGAVDHAVA